MVKQGKKKTQTMDHVNCIHISHEIRAEFQVTSSLISPDQATLPRNYTARNSDAADQRAWAISLHVYMQFRWSFLELGLEKRKDFLFSASFKFLFTTWNSWKLCLTQSITTIQFKC